MRITQIRHHQFNLQGAHRIRFEGDRQKEWLLQVCSLNLRGTISWTLFCLVHSPISRVEYKLILGKVISQWLFQLLFWGTLGYNEESSLLSTWWRLEGTFYFFHWRTPMSQVNEESLHSQYFSFCWWYLQL